MLVSFLFKIDELFWWIDVRDRSIPRDSRLFRFIYHLSLYWANKLPNYADLRPIYGEHPWMN